MTDIQETADKIEIRMARAYVKSVQRLKRSISVDKLAKAITTGNAGKIFQLIPKEKVEDTLGPMSIIVWDAVMKGGKIGAEEINTVRR